VRASAINAQLDADHAHLQVFVTHVIQDFISVQTIVMDALLTVSAAHLHQVAKLAFILMLQYQAIVVRLNALDVQEALVPDAMMAIYSKTANVITALQVAISVNLVNANAHQATIFKTTSATYATINAQAARPLILVCLVIILLY
jgi:hypothetical protein